jgi:hypothetical protein
MPLSWNRYLYTSVDPVRAVDPLGTTEFYEEYAVLTGPTRTIVPNIATKANVFVEFGSNANAEYHAFRHVVAVGLDKSEVEFAIRTLTQEILDVGVVENFSGLITLNGYNLGFSAFFRTTLLLNIGKIIIR